MRLEVPLGLAVLVAALAVSAQESAERSVGDRRILVFSKTAAFRHASIPDGIAAVRKLGAQNGFEVEASEDANLFNDGDLSRFDAVLFLCTTGSIFLPSQQAALERYLEGGKGYVGVHSASDTEHTWPWYGALVGAYFLNHPYQQTATIRLEDRLHPSTRNLPNPWRRFDEWYNFNANPRAKVHVLAVLDETSYAGGQMGSDHPIAWCQYYDRGRSWYTALGHTSETYSEPLFLEHLMGGIRFAAGYPDTDCDTPRSVAPRH